MSQERTSRQAASEPDTKTAVANPDRSGSRPTTGSISWHAVDMGPLTRGAGSSSTHSPLPRKDQITAHLDLICRSPSFASSKRCQQFLRYIMLETLAGRGDQIKERNIANEVFGKGAEFEPGEDSLVRVKAREVRKRLSDFYELTPPDGLQIELPLGGYVPRIYCSSPADTVDTPAISPDVPVASGTSRRKMLWILGGVAGIAAAATTWRLFEPHETPLDRLWAPVFATKTPLVVFIPILKDRVDGAVSDRVGIGPTAALRRAADFLVAHHYPYHLRFGADLTFAQLREQPSLLLGGFSSIWTQLMTGNLRFTLVGTGLFNDPVNQSVIVDRQTKKVWHPSNITPEGYATEDYGLLCRLFDKDSGQIAMIAGGITTFGTEGAASVFFNPDSFAELLKQAPADWEKRNFEAVIRVSIIGSTPSSPQIVATHFW